MLESTRISEQKSTLEKEKRAIETKRLGTRYNFLTGGEDDFNARQTEVNEMNSRVAAINAEIDGLDERLIKALDDEDTAAQAAMARHADTTEWTPELRELNDVAKRTSFRDYVDSVIRDLPLAGAAREYSEHVLERWAPGEFPLEMLLDRDSPFDLDQLMQFKLADKEDEERAVITGTAADAGMLTWAERLFSMSEAMYLGARMPTVGAGRHSYPIISGSTTATAYARGGTETPGGSLTIANADPERIQHSYEYGMVDELQMPGIANALAMDLRASLMSGLDNKVVDDLTAAISDVTPDATTTVETLSNFLSRFGLLVDGKVAYDVRDVRALVGTALKSGVSSYTVLSASSIANIAHWFTMPAEFHARVRGSAHLPAPPGDDDQVALFYGSRGPTRLFAPVWRRGQILRDTGRLQLNNEVTLTGVMFADVITVNTEPYRKGELHTA